MDETFDSSALRTKVEEALRFFVKLPMRKPASADPSGNAAGNASGNAFLEIPGPKGKAIVFSESEGRVDVAFGPGRGSFDFSGSGFEDEDEEVPLSAEAAEAELEEDFKEELEGMVNLALDILDESVFAARYLEDGVPLEGLFPAEEFEDMKANAGFTEPVLEGRVRFGREGLGRMRLTREEMCARIEEVLRALAPGDYEKQDTGEFFLIRRGPNGADLEYYCDESEARVDFGPSGGDFLEYNTIDEDGEDDFTEEDLKDILKDFVTTTFEIVSEELFAASYKSFFTRVGGLYPIDRFPEISVKKGLESLSWNGSYTRNYPAQ